ncbi:MAG: glutaredoxin domain-containing protein [Acidobacteriota bacterium]|nr:glutaredoxin domain-containing protein [Acidobacteriota bacterium]
MTDGPTSPTVRIYTKKWCGFCFAARRLFKSLGIEFEEIPVDRDPELRRQVSGRAGNWPTVPMIFVGDDFVGGYTEAAALHRKDQLLPLCRP